MGWFLCRPQMSGSLGRGGKVYEMRSSDLGKSRSQEGVFQRLERPGRVVVVNQGLI